MRVAARKALTRTSSTIEFDRIAATLAALVVIGLAAFLFVRNEAFASEQLFFVVRVVLSFAVAVLGATTPGFLEIGWKGSGLAIRAGGAFALFVLTFAYTPSPIQGRSEADRVVEQQRHAELRQGQEELLHGNQQILAVIAREKGVPHATLQAVLLRMGEVGVPDEAIEARLRAKADEYVALRTELERRQREQPTAAAAARARAQVLLDEGDFDGARAVLAEGRADLRARREQTAREEADLASEAARVARLSLRYRDAAGLYAEAADLVAFDAEAAWALTLDAAGALYDQGNEFGDNAALHEAIAICRGALALVPRDQRPLQWAMTQMNLGNALAALGEREAGTARLEEAVAAYWAALDERTRERVPLDWARTQMNLGAALWALGSREPGTVRLEEAVATYRAALEEWTRERVPLDWARTQMNLGVALAALGSREAGTARLEGAVASYRATLEEWTRERVPLDWARTQMNLGVALADLGSREAGTARLEEAIAAFDACLTVTASVWPDAWVRDVRSRLEAALTEVTRRRSG